MSFKPNVPQANDFISQSQRDFKTNFTRVNDIWGKQPTESDNVGDHVPLLDPDEDIRGKHKKTTFVQQAAHPATPANEADLYSFEANGAPELHYRRNGDASGNQITDTGGLSIGGLVLRAHVVFDIEGNILNAQGVDEDGEEIEVPMSFNIDGITVNDTTSSGKALPDYTITFTDSLGTADYVWVLQSFNKTAPRSGSKLPRANMQPYNSATYGNVVTDTSIRINGYVFNHPGTVINPRNRAQDRFMRMMFQAYTVTA